MAFRAFCSSSPNLIVSATRRFSFNRTFNPFIVPAMEHPKNIGSSSSRPSNPSSPSLSTTSAKGRGSGWGGTQTREDRRSRGGRGRDSAGTDKIDSLGRLLTRILRHMASELKLDMRSDGFVRVQDLLRLNLVTFSKIPLSLHTVADIKEAVRRDNKQRFSLLEENGELFIRANQGHTITTISSEGLLKSILSPDEAPGKSIVKVREDCMRKNVNVLIFLDVRKALEEGMKLYMSDNKVILTEGFNGVVPVKYFEKIETWPGREPIPFSTMQ
ncbi:hypothetical protein QJS10_CPB20g01533 [Acorus calamus]|uniref:2'-phosphotransferase n=1 Tax=Acorus calamus TaxID=4465 RepID=A0AAV9C9I0_ACOCL|nr:hypothetical protein QJS10_CPB20g01533 [Acorus calamus]